MKHTSLPAGARLGLIVTIAIGLVGCDGPHKPPLPISGVPAVEASTPSAPTQPPKPQSQAPSPISEAKAAAPSDTATTLQTRGLDHPSLNVQLDQWIEAHPSAAGPAASKAHLTATEVNFLTRALEESAFHFQASQLALDRARNSAVKSYAALIVYDHPQVNSELQTMAKQMGLLLPEVLSAPKKEQLDKLMRASDGEFDKQYLASSGIENQLQMIALFEKTWRETQHPDLKSFVMATLPTLQSHLGAAERLPLHG